VITRASLAHLLLAAALCAAPTHAFAGDDDAPTPVLRVAIDDEPPGAALAAIDRAGALAFPVAVRVAIPALPADASIDARLQALAARKLPVWLSLPAAASADELEGWRDAVRALLDRHGAALAVLEIDVDRQPARIATFAVQAAATDVRADHDRIHIAIGGAAMNDPARREAIYRAELAPYVDLLAVDDASDPALGAWLHRVDATASIVVSGARAAAAPDAARQLVDGVLRDLGTDVTLHAWPAADFSPTTVAALGQIADLLTGEITALDPAGVGLALRNAGGDVTASLAHRLLFNERTFATYLVYWGGASSDPLQMTLVLPVEGVPGVHDVLTGARTGAAGYTREQATGKVQASAPLTGRPMVVDFNEGAADVMMERSGVTAVKALSIDEIIARHQQQQRAQDAIVRSYVAHARMQQHFRPTVADNGMSSSYDVLTENRYFVAGSDVEWEELSFSVNGAKWGADRPAFPLLQPEKVLSLPLLLRFDQAYRYRLEGSERVDDYDCYVVGFEPVRADAALYTGTVWIDKKTFARVKVQAVQGGLSAPVISNEEIQRYSPVAVGNRPVFLFTALTARQIVLIAGRNLLVEKSVEFSGFHVNAEDFDRERASARESDRVMYRETDAGLRYYVKEDGRRVVSDRPTTHAKAMAIGTTIDPSYSFPLPMFGIDYLNFHFGSPNQQLAVLFAGVLAAGNVQRSRIGNTHLDASVDFFAIAAPSSDLVYSPAQELATERLLTWPLTTGFNLGWQATPFQKLSFQYQFRFDAYVRDRTTSEAFDVPSSTVTNGIGGAYELRRGGYSFLLNGTWYDRASWKPWGVRQPGEFHAATTTPGRYEKYSGSLSRDFFMGPFQKIHVNGAWFGGHDLDRFTEYQFGMFDDTRIHGVPASGVRYGELAMARGSYSLNIFEQYRLELFLDRAWGRVDPGHGVWDPITGFGIAGNTRGPWNTILRLDFGKSFLPDRYGPLGSTVVQVLLLKPLR
jgi:hypothetical protein